MIKRLIEYTSIFLFCIIPIIIAKNGYSIFTYPKVNIIYMLGLLGITFYLYKTKTENFLFKIFILLIICVLPLIVVEYGGDYFSYIKINYVYILCLIVSAILLVKRKKSDKIILTSDYILTIYLILSVISTITSVSIVRSILGKIYRFEGIAAINCYILIYIISSKYYEFEKKHIKYMIISAVIISLYGIAQYFGYDPLFPLVKNTWNYESYSTIGHRNFLGSYLTLILPIIIFLYVYTSKKLYLLSSSIIFLSMLCIYTRSAWVAFFIYIPIMFFLLVGYSKFNTKRFASVVLIFIAISVVFNIYSNNNLFNRFITISKDANSLLTSESNREDGGSARVFIWQRTIKLIPKRPFLGSGPDTLDIVLYENYSNELKDKFGKDSIVDKAHNEYLQIAVTTGIPSLICYLSFLSIILFRAWKNIKNKVYIIPVFCSIIGYIVQAFFNISVVGVAPVYWALLGILTNFTENDIKEISNF